MQMTPEMWMLASAGAGLLIGLLLWSIFSYISHKKIQHLRLTQAASDEQLKSLNQQLEQRDHQINEKEQHLQQARQVENGLREDLSRTQSQMTAERRAAQEKLALLDEARSGLSDAFKALSADALQANNQQFIDLAKATLGRFQESAQGDLNQRQQAIDNLVKPLKSSLEKVELNIQQLEKAREGAYQGLSQKLLDLSTAQARLQSETANLVTALRSPTVRGRWGEIQLKRVVELAGMVNYCDFFEQQTVTSDKGSLRPDMLIKLPNDKQIVVDSKAPLMAYLEALEAKSEEQRIACLQNHARQIRTHLQQLSSKGYWSQFSNSPEFVVLFLPGETFFSAALEQDPSLIEVGVNQNVILATPTTLIALLKAVAYGWRQETLTENAQQISQLGQELYDRLATLTRHFGDVKKGLDRAVDSYNKAVGTMESRVLVSARKFKDLGADTGKEIASSEPVDVGTRTLEAPEAAQKPTDPPS